MISLVKPRVLGLKEEFRYQFANPIKASRHKDSKKDQIRIMKYQSLILYTLVQGFIHRRDVSLLRSFLPPKFEYTIYVPLTPIQEKLYNHYVTCCRVEGELNGLKMIFDCQALRKIYTHVRVFYRNSNISF